MHRNLTKIEGGAEVLLTAQEVAQFDQRETAAVERRQNQHVQKSPVERIVELEAANADFAARLGVLEAG